jgi:hypothetical protein
MRLDTRGHIKSREDAAIVALAIVLEIIEFVIGIVRENFVEFLSATGGSSSRHLALRKWIATSGEIQYKPTLACKRRVEPTIAKSPTCA